MMGEKKEFPKEEFSSFRCVLECSETRYVFSPWLDSFFFIVAGVDLGLHTRAKPALLAECSCLYSRLALVHVSVLSMPHRA